MSPKLKILPSRSFTLIELLAVVAVIAILAGLVLGGAGAVRQRAARGQAKAEISAIEAGLARYQMDFGAYPVPSNAISSGASGYDPAPKNYEEAGRALFSALWGTDKFNATNVAGKSYLSVKASMVSTSTASDFLTDPWGRAYGYYWSGTNSLYGGAAPDVWSTGNGTNAAATNKWITSWQ